MLESKEIKVNLFHKLFFPLYLVRQADTDFGIFGQVS